MREHWSEISEIWKQVGAPLRPSKEDLSFIISKMDALNSSDNALNALVLGVTPEYFHLPWPQSTNLLAADHTKQMINELWPGPEESALCCEWTHLSDEASAMDIILCDGGLHLLPYPDEQKRLVTEIHNILRPGGIFILRLFLPPEEEQSLDNIINNLLDGKIANLNELKLQLWAALQEDKQSGVHLHDVWSAIHQAAPDLELLADDLNWQRDHLNVINTYKNSEKRYYLITLNDVIDLFTIAPGGFTLKQIEEPSYKFGKRCPTVTFKCK